MNGLTVNTKITLLLSHLSQEGFTFAVGDQEGNIQKRTNSSNLAIDAISSVEECYIRVFKGVIKGRGHKGYLYVSDQGIFDHTDNEFLSQLVANFGLD